MIHSQKSTPRLLSHPAPDPPPRTSPPPTHLTHQPAIPSRRGYGALSSSEHVVVGRIPVARVARKQGASRAREPLRLCEHVQQPCLSCHQPVYFVVQVLDGATRLLLQCQQPVLDRPLGASLFLGSLATYRAHTHTHTHTHLRSRLS
jgi:hypothetical protein